jgi:hypothetical protein
MAEYWSSRYAETLSELGQAQSPLLRSAYLDLANHYRLLSQWCDRSARNSRCIAT